jgi:gluconate 2-dehydrogenase gamma chain
MEQPSRRRLLEVALASGLARRAWAQGRPFRVLSAADAAEVEALAAEIIPTTDTPGAREAGVIHFIDQALATFDADKRGDYSAGLAMVQQKRREMFPTSPSIAGLGAAERRSLLGAVESTPFFETLRTHTVTGFLANPEHGGNRNGVGWKLIGFESAHHFAPPFGHYDREENR